MWQKHEFQYEGNREDEDEDENEHNNDEYEYYQDEDGYMVENKDEEVFEVKMRRNGPLVRQQVKY